MRQEKTCKVRLIKILEILRQDSDWVKIEIWYPSEMKDSNAKYPLVIMANRTGIKASAYTEVFRHLASWGFIIAGNEDENSRSGASSEATLEYVLQLNSESGSIFSGKIDTENIGIAGHSQGGVGAINAVAEQPSGYKYKAIWTASAPTYQISVDLLKASYDVSSIKIPYFMVAGTLQIDAGNGTDSGIAPLWSLQEKYNAITADIPKVLARRKDTDHGDMLPYADGYMTAWFMYWLKDDKQADFFSGDNAEILTNALWQDVEKNR